MPHTSAVYLESLQARHSAIDNRLRMEQGRPGACEWLIKRLKRQKLHLKEQIEGVSA